MFLLYHLLPLFLIVLWQLWRHYIKFTRYVLDIGGGLHVLCVPDVTNVLTFPSLFLHDTWRICSYCTQCTNVSHSIIKTRFFNWYSGVFISFVPTVPDVTIVPYSLMASMITAHNLEYSIVSDSYVPIVLDVTIVLDS